MTKKINGNKIAEKIKDTVTKEIFELNGPRPNLAIVLVGTRPDSNLYVSLKEKEAKKVGIDTHLYKCEAETSEDKIVELVKHLNEDPLINGIIVQLPLPEHINTDKVINLIDPKKDADGFHPKNKLVKSPVHSTVFKMIEEISFDPKDKKVVIISNSEVFAKPLSEALKEKGADSIILGTDDKDLKSQTSQADLLITAIGKACFVTKDMVKDGVVIIDVGITKKDSLIFGDVDYENIFPKASYISPVPGGVGPMTIAYLFKNTLELFKAGR